MFENFVASVAPKSFNLERYLAKSKQLTKISTKVADNIKQKLQDEYSYSNRSGHLASATACNGTILTIDDTTLAKALYVAVTSEDFNEKLNAAYTHIKCFGNMKFFINKKLQEVCFVHYTCELDRSKDFLSTVYDSLLELVSLFSTSEYTVQVDYYDLFRKFLWGSSKTAFLTCFFLSIIPYEYNFSTRELGNIASLFLDFDRLSSDLHTRVPGMYLEHTDLFFENSNWPRNIRINLLRYIQDKNAFSSYDEFFRKHNTDNVLSASENIETLNFVFDENALQNALDLKSDPEELSISMVKATWDMNQHFVIKIKDVKHVSTYIDNIFECFESGFLNTCSVVPNATKEAVYLFFSAPLAFSLEEKSATGEYASITAIMQQLPKREWNFSFKDGAPVLKCFYLIDDTLYLNPLFIDQLDFGNTGKTLDYKLIVLSIIGKFVESRKIKVDNIFTYSFMKILPPYFAKNVISYLESGTLLDENTDTWGDVLTFGELSRIRFVHNLSRICPDFVTFFQSAHSDSNVQEFISKRTPNLENDYIISPGCLGYISDIGLELTDENLAKIFTYKEGFYFHPTKVIISRDSCDSNNYQIIGVVWNECGLTTIGELYRQSKVDAPVFYKLLSSLLSIEKKHPWMIDKDNICSMLVDKDYNVFLNVNTLKEQNLSKSRYSEDLFDNLYNALNAHRDTSMPFEYFTYDELYDDGKKSTASNVLLCTDHNRYYIEGSLCPECRKIYCVTDGHSSTLYNCGRGNWNFSKINLKHSLIAGHYGSNLSPWIIRQCKSGIENGLFEKFFFKPDSLALYNDKVVGVVYFGMGDFDFSKLLPISMFESRQRLQVVQVMYKKLLPLILDGFCIVDNKDFFDSIAMHKDYKGELIILKLPFMNCEAILAKDKNAMDETRLMFAEFLVNYIKDDSCLNAACAIKSSVLYELIEDINSLKFTSSILEECISAFCSVHNIPFSSKKRLCPLCIADGISADDIVVLPDTHFQELQEGKPAFEGGEATLYPYSEDQIQKLFKPGVDLAFKSKILGKALQKRAQFKSFNNEHTDIKFITIDKVQYSASKKTITLEGFVQEKIDKSFKISCLKDKDFVTSQGYTRRDIVEILIKVCIGIEFLHSIGGYIGDLNGGNILIKDKTVYFIDMDGMSFDDVKNFVFTDMYIYPPSAENKKITKDDDWYSLAIQAFYYFTYSHPFRGISSSKLVPADEISRMKLGMSVLGNHGIKVPNISIGWDFLPKELIQFFKNTFEGKKRESMRSVLEKFKNSLDTSESKKVMKFTEVNRSYPCRFALSYNTYIDTSGHLLWCERKLLRFSSGTISCKITGNYIILTSPNNSVVLNDITGRFNVYSAISKDDKVYAANDNLYYISSSDNNVHVKQISSRSQQEADGIVVNASTLSPFDFLVTDDRKFIFLVKDDMYVHIYCNLEELTLVNTSQLGDNVQSHLFYDNESGNYLVLLSGCNKTVGVVISSDGSYSMFNLNKEISNSSCFYKNTLYYMIGDTIYFYNVIDNTEKEFTSQFAASGCLIERRANRFVICSNDKTYMYVKS